MDWLWLSFYHALAMLWATFWALVLGFTISGVLQVFISKEQMTRAFGRTNLKSVAIATGLGAASSSCSYAAVAAARSAIQQGAALVPALAFMFASTNLVIELGAVLWVLMGWTFVVAEFVGALILIALVWLFIRLFLPKILRAKSVCGPPSEQPTDLFIRPVRLICLITIQSARPLTTIMSMTQRKRVGREWRTLSSPIGRCSGKKFSAGS